MANESAPSEVNATTWWARGAYLVGVGAHTGLIALLLSWIVWLDPPPASLISPAVLVVVGPLLIPFRGLLHARRYTLAWSTLLILAYFIHGIVYALGAGLSVWLGSAEAMLALVYFGAINTYLRATRAPRAPRE